MRTSPPRPGRPVASSSYRTRGSVRDADDVLRISCDGCISTGTPTCDECIVTFLVDRDAKGTNTTTDGVIAHDMVNHGTVSGDTDSDGTDSNDTVSGVALDASEARAVQLLQAAGLAPRLRHTGVLSLVGH